jgi:ribosome-binding protein aMBF1 (putative translation factor)
MDECFKCQIPESRALLFDAVISGGIVKVCGKCVANGNIPVIKNKFKPEVEKPPKVSERLSKISGVSLSDMREKEPEKDITLRRLVEMNIEKDLTGFRQDPEAKKNFIENFHWIVMRGRRSKHLTQEQFANEIHEPVKVIKLIERGFIPQKIEILDKIESFLGVRLRKEITTSKERVEKIDFEEFNFRNVEDITLADLQELKRKKEEGLFE